MQEVSTPNDPRVLVVKGGGPRNKDRRLSAASSRITGREFGELEAIELLCRKYDKVGLTFERVCWN